MEKTGISDECVKPLIEMLHTMRNLQYINFSSNLLSTPSFEALIEVFSSKRKISLTNLDLSNNKMGDKLAIKFIHTLLNSPNMLEILNLSRSNLGFKTGAVVMNLLVEPKIKETTRLRVIDLSYNTISLLL